MIDRQSAYEMLTKKIVTTEIEDDQHATGSNKKEEGSSIADTISNVAKNPLEKQVAREITRGIFGVLFGKSTSRRR